jgi:hypothetical protein
MPQVGGGIRICIQRDKIWETLLVRSVSQPLPKNFQYSPKPIVFLWKNWAWESAKSFLEGPGTFFTKKVPGF